jgi:hypothetical protein
MVAGHVMVGDMFNTQLKAKLDALCSDIAAHFESYQISLGIGNDVTRGP